LSNGLVVAFLTFVVRVKEQENGSMLPRAFDRVLYLDAFEGGPSKAALPNSAASHGSGRTDLGNVPSAVIYEGGCPIPTRPEDMAATDAVQDFSHFIGAPKGQDTIQAGKPSAKEFWGSVSFMPPQARERGFLDDLFLERATAAIFGAPGKVQETSIVTGHDEEKPGLLPWRIFRVAALLTCFAWFSASAAALISAESFSRQAVGQKRSIHQQTELSFAWSAMSLLEVGHHHEDMSNFMVEVKWPYASFLPKSVACDVAGNDLLVTDGVSLFKASIDQDSTSTNFQSVPFCKGLLGEKLQDVALRCPPGDSQCEATVLHRKGLRMSHCRLGHNALDTHIENISTSWRQASSEEASWLMVDQHCAAEPSCTKVGTSEGRTVLLQRSESGHELVASDVLEAASDSRRRPGRPDAMRALNGRYLGTLWAGQRSIEIQDLEGSGKSGKLHLPMAEPMSTFCVGGGSAFLVGQGRSPKMWRVPLPPSLLEN